MRPLSRPPWAARWAGRSASEVARYGLGFYCAACELRLAQDAVAWDASRRIVLRRGAAIGDWPQLLPLCRRCAAAAMRSGKTPIEQLLLPDRHLTFTLAGTSPFTYTRDDRTGHVTVVPAPGPAATTVDYFALNGLFATEPLPTAPRTPQTEEQAAIIDYLDPRPGLRDSVWEQADYLATRLEETSGREREELAGRVHLVATNSGFWSVWATVLWTKLHDRDVLETVLQPPSPRPTSTAAAAAVTTTSNAFTATRPDWLPAAER
jgi:hypothetical protein